MEKPKCPSTDEWIKMCYTYTLAYYLTIKMNKTWSFIEMWMDLEFVTPSKVRQEKKNKYCILMQKGRGMALMSALMSVLMALMRGEWQSTPVFLPGESHGLRSLEGYHP